MSKKDEALRELMGAAESILVDKVLSDYSRNRLAAAVDAAQAALAEQPAVLHMGKPVKVAVRGTNQQLPVVGHYDDTVFVHLESAAPASGELEQIIDDYVDDYEFCGEDDSGADATHTPGEFERTVIKDAIMGLLATPAILASVIPPGCVVVKDEPVAWYDPADFTRTTASKTEKEFAPLYARPGAPK